METNLEVGVLAELVEEESENGIGFGLGNPNNTSSEA